MTDKNGYLVVGGDSLVGGEVFRAAAHRGHRVFASTRRRDTLGPQRIYFDFESDEPFHVPPGIRSVFLVAAATNYDRCETDPMARRINVELIPRAVTSLLEKGLFVNFVSTNSVFGGERPWPNEDDPHTPGIAYARQKSEGEKAIGAAARNSNAQDRLSIVRLTKILNAQVPPIPAWLSAWKRSEVVQPFSDLIFAPMSVRFVGEALVTIGEKRIPGNLHLSGAENVTYVDLANALARRLGVDAALIAPTSAMAKGVNIAFKPTYSGLGMNRTTKLSGLNPQTLEDVISDLLATVDHS